MSPRSKRAILGVLVILIIAFFVFRPRPRGPMGEYVSPNEDYLTGQIVADAVRMVDMSRQYMTAHPLPGYPPQAADKAAPAVGKAAAPAGQPYMRDVHSKTHGCLKANFIVPDGLDSRYRFGVFEKPAQYHAWIRFSSGKEYPHPDSDRDARGMAIKIMSVPGKKLLEADGVPPAMTQDFVLMNATQFFIRNVDEYAAFTKALSSGLGLGAQMEYFTGGWPIPNPFRSHPREMWLALKTLKPAPDSLLNTNFYSVSAYKLGPELNVKYSARPCAKTGAAKVDRSDPNFLRKEMAAHLANAGACFDFMVQPQIKGKNMPVEDTTVEWSEKDSPFVPLARLDIPAQQFEQNNDVCENLSFNPWHSLPEHRPIGIMNRLRKAVYLEVSRYRREKNGAPLCEPKDWGVDDPASCETVGVLPVTASKTQVAGGQPK